MKVLIVAPHADDEIIGVGGTILKHVEQGDEVSVLIVTRPREPVFRENLFDVIRSETKEAHRFLQIKKTYFLELPAVMLESVPRYEINQKLIEVMKEAKPDTVYIPHIGDMQKDHQIVTEACMVALRPKYDFAPKRIYMYETLSETGWNIPNVQNEFIPNAYTDISKYMEQKTEAMNLYHSQVGVFPEARSAEAMEALAKYRGAVMGMPAAEAFMLIREIW